MEIINKITDRRIKFGGLAIGDVFYSKERSQYFIKIGTCLSKYRQDLELNAVSLNFGAADAIDMDETVDEYPEAKVFIGDDYESY